MVEKVFTTSRYGDERYIKHVEDNKYLVYGKSAYGRTIGDYRIEAYDFEGGPYLSIGSQAYMFDNKLYIDKILPAAGPIKKFTYIHIYLVDELTNRVNRLTDAKENFSYYLKGKIKDGKEIVNKLFDAFIKSEVGKHESFIIDFENYDIDQYIEAVLPERYQTIEVENLLYFSEFINTSEELFKKEILDKFVKSFTFDW